MAAMTARAPWASSSPQQQVGDVAALEASWTSEAVSTGVRVLTVLNSSTLEKLKKCLSQIQDERICAVLVTIL